jgi:hypothetical protein
MVESIYGKSSVAIAHRKIFLEIDQSETRIACGGHVCTWIGTKLALIIENRFIWPSG